MVYEWKSTARIKVDANVAGQIFEELEQTVGLTAENLLNASRNENAPLHNEFEWDDDIAAEEYRKEQARYLIRNLCVQTEQKCETPVRAYFIVNSKSYENIQTIFTDGVKHCALLDIALKELKAFQQKYKMLKELYPVFCAIETLTNAGQAEDDNA